VNLTGTTQITIWAAEVIQSGVHEYYLIIINLKGKSMLTIDNLQTNLYIKENIIIKFIKMPRSQGITSTSKTTPDPGCSAFKEPETSDIGCQAHKKPS
jgi:hypothetical protein